MLDTLCKISLLIAESHEVIGLRLSKIARFEPDAVEEFMLMGSEKIAAAGANAARIMSGVPLDEIVDDYREIVRANAHRLTAH